jgi:hypothetical protein
MKRCRGIRSVRLVDPGSMPLGKLRMINLFCKRRMMDASSSVNSHILYDYIFDRIDTVCNISVKRLLVSGELLRGVTEAPTDQPILL